MKNTFLGFLVFVSVLNVDAQLNLDSGLVSYLSFDEKIEDNSNNQYVTRELGSVTIEKECGNSYLVFSEGSGVEVVIPDTSVYAMSFYVKGDERIDELSKMIVPVSLFETGLASSQVGAFVFLGDFSNMGVSEKVSLTYNNNPQGYFERTFVTEGELDDKWHHIIFNYADGRYNVFIDGVIQNVTKGTSSGYLGLTNIVNPIIGTRLFSNGNIAETAGGAIDEVRFYNRTITAEEILYLSSEKDWDLNDDLIFHLSFDEGYNDQSLNEFATEIIGETEIEAAVTNSYLSFSEKSGVKINVLDTTVYAISFYIKGNERIDELSKMIVPITFNESGIESSQIGAFTFLGDFSNMGVSERVSLTYNNNSEGVFQRTFVTNRELDDKWHHVVYNYNGDLYEIYIDGVKQNVTKGSSSNHVPLINMNNPIIGTRVFSNGDLSSTAGGAIDEVRAFSRSLTSNEIQCLANEHDWEMLITSNKNSIETELGLFPTILNVGSTLNANEEIENVVFYDLEGIELVSYSTLKDFDLSNLSEGVSFAKVIFKSGKVITQKIIKE